MTEQRKLPFVWKLESGEIVSHAIGSPHAINVDYRIYVPALFRLIEDKGCVLVEELQGFGGLDALAETVAKERNMHLAGLSTADESTAYYTEYAFPLENNPEAARAFKNGDAESMRKLYLKNQLRLDSEKTKTVQEYHQKRMRNTVEKLRTVPTLVIIDLAHFLVEPTEIRAYENNGIAVQRIQ
jgi:hypothetical protein